MTLAKVGKIEIRISSHLSRYIKVHWLRALANEIKKVAKVNPELSFEVFVSGQKTIKKLNFDYRNIDKATDVLSFSMGQENKKERFNAMKNRETLGSIVISYPAAVKQGLRYGHSTEVEIASLLIHGLLHLSGYDHAKAGQRKKMRDEESKILGLLREEVLANSNLDDYG